MAPNEALDRMDSRREKAKESGVLPRTYRIPFDYNKPFTTVLGHAILLWELRRREVS